MSQIRILIVDDHPVVRAGLSGMLAAQPDFLLVGEAADGSEALELAKEVKPDVVLMDLRMPKMDGVRATEKLRDLPAGPRVLILSTYDGDSDILRAIEAGAKGYLLKDAPREELFVAIRRIASGQTQLAPKVAERLVAHMQEHIEALTERELQVLRLVQKGLSNREIALHLRVSEATVKTHLLHIFGKLSVNDRTAAVTTALRKGLLTL